MQALAKVQQSLHCSVLRVLTPCDAHMWPVGQAVKTAASHAANVGSIPARVTISHAPLAQLVEQLTLNQWVPGSSP